jgi:hypothetical protein
MQNLLQNKEKFCYALYYATVFNIPPQHRRNTAATPPQHRRNTAATPL